MMLLAWSIDVSSHIIDAMLQALLQHFSKENLCHTKNATGMVHWCGIARGVLYGHQPHRMPYMASQPVVGLPHDDIPTNWIGCWMLLRQNLPKQQLCRKHERAQRMSFFVKQVHRCLASCDSSTCVVILKPTSATRHQRHVQSWAVCRFVLFVSADTGWLLAASMFCTIVKIHKPVVCCKKMPKREFHQLWVWRHIQDQPFDHLRSSFGSFIQPSGSRAKFNKPIMINNFMVEVNTPATVSRAVYQSAFFNLLLSNPELYSSLPEVIAEWCVKCFPPSGCTWQFRKIHSMICPSISGPNK